MKKSMLLDQQHAKVLITGSRNYRSYATVGKAIGIAINDLGAQGFKEITFMQGGASGADEHAVEFINKVEKSIFRLTGIKIRYETYLPDFAKYGSPAAYHIRNQEMVDQHPVHALVFLEPGEENGGTLSTVRRLRTADIPYTAYGAVEMLDKL